MESDGKKGILLQARITTGIEKGKLFVTTSVAGVGFLAALVASMSSVGFLEAILIFLIVVSFLLSVFIFHLLTSAVNKYIEKIYADEDTGEYDLKLKMFERDYVNLFFCGLASMCCLVCVLVLKKIGV